MENAQHVSGQDYDKERLTLGSVDGLKKVVAFHDGLFERIVLDHHKSDDSVTLSPDTSGYDTEASQTFN